MALWRPLGGRRPQGAKSSKRRNKCGQAASSLTFGAVLWLNGLVRRVQMWFKSRVPTSFKKSFKQAATSATLTFSASGHRPLSQVPPSPLAAGTAGSPPIQEAGVAGKEGLATNAILAKHVCGASLDSMLALTVASSPCRSWWSHDISMHGCDVAYS